MSKTDVIVIILMMAFAKSFAQTINYQGIARNAQGAPLANKPIAVKLSIKDAASGGNTFYTEAKTTTTNDFGLYAISVNDGSGNRVGNFSSINWSQPTYMQTEIDPQNGTDFRDMGTSLMQSVPSAIVAKNLAGVINPQQGDMLVYKNDRWQKKPAIRYYQIRTPTAKPLISPNFMVKQEIEITKANPLLKINAVASIGSIATGGATGLVLNLGYRRKDDPDLSVIPFNTVHAIGGLRVASGTRLPILVNGIYQSSLDPGIYEIGVIGNAASQAAADRWNDNGPGMVIIEIEYP